MTKDFDRQKILETGQRVLSIESAALSKYADVLGDGFADAVQLMAKTGGRIVVCGMGKSGHVARKIAATLASTGSPAQFVHPGEASHGDMGMITNKDVALVLSNSGETPELSDIIAHTRRFGIPMIGVASRRNSTLLEQSDVALVLPTAPEACTVGLAPTTSTTMTMALGDALAVALMEQREFSPENYRDFHPGGNLGARLATVSKLMHSGDEIPIVDINEPMSQALLIITAKGFGVAGVTQENNLVGVITDGDLRRHMDGLLDRTAAEVMTSNPKTIEYGSLAQEALGVMNERKITTLFVVDEKSPDIPVGILHLHDCLRAGLG